MPKLKPRRSLRKGKFMQRGLHPNSARTRWQRKQLIAIYHGRCCYCLREVNLGKDSPLSATVDHMLPIALGGSDAISNLRLACYACNHEKGEGIGLDIFTVQR